MVVEVEEDEMLWYVEMVEGVVRGIVVGRGIGMWAMG